MKKIDISQMDLIQLKASAYDVLAEIELQQNNLKKINQLIAEKQNELGRNTMGEVEVDTMTITGE